MVKNFEFIEGTNNYLLMKNRAIFKTWDKRTNSRQEAKEKSSEVVTFHIRKYGARNVTYNEFISVN